MPTESCEAQFIPGPVGSWDEVFCILDELPGFGLRSEPLQQFDACELLRFSSVWVDGLHRKVTASNFRTKTLVPIRNFRLSSQCDAVLPPCVDLSVDSSHDVHHHIFD